MALALYMVQCSLFSNGVKNLWNIGLNANLLHVFQGGRSG